MIQGLGTNIFCPAEDLPKLKDQMAQLVGANVIVIDPINNAELAEAIISTPAGRKLVRDAVDRAVAKQMKKG